MHVAGIFRFAHIDGLIPSDPAVYARLAKIHSDESRTRGLDRLELIRFLHVAQTITVHDGAVAHLAGHQTPCEPPRPRPSGSRTTERRCGVIEFCTWSARATMPITVPVLRVLEACRGDRTEDP
jgi:integrase/recombinase XerD